VRIAGYIYYNMEESLAADREPEAAEVPHSLEVAHYHNIQHSRHVMPRDLVEARMVGFRLGMVGYLGEGSLAIDLEAVLGYYHHMVDLVEVILLKGIACWLPGPVRSEGLA
jgi:hypothetical protein